MTKPVIRIFHGAWRCRGLGAVGYGLTPKKAWECWFRKLEAPAVASYLENAHRRMLVAGGRRFSDIDRRT